ncbi:helix-hairpin-helix domain-containing protein [Jeotgalibacillus proteolyticus]|uniref:helix-hairpin-helix domain-containing protein n=1 Tax=Jeotgalibacillus proteolyticus TaxID=2082395 RepID=UPI001FD67F7E|nr:helix-hairpin-helix domain-containing protein [Jeotgalibacillus proteolyticus]
MKQWLDSNKRSIVIIPPVLLIAFLLFNLFTNPSEVPVPTPMIPDEEITYAAAEQTVPLSYELIKVDLKGAVKVPGVYTVKEGERVADLIEQAGFQTENADMTGVNLSLKLVDEMVIYIPEEGEEMPDNMSQTSTAANSQESKININQADAVLLETIPGIGPAKAQAIIDYRENEGGFKTIEDIKNISGIGDKTFDKMKDVIDIK